MNKPHLFNNDKTIKYFTKIYNKENPTYNYIYNNLFNIIPIFLIICFSLYFYFKYNEKIKYNKFIKKYNNSISENINNNNKEKKDIENKDIENKDNRDIENKDNRYNENKDNRDNENKDTVHNDIIKNFNVDTRLIFDTSMDPMHYINNTKLYENDNRFKINNANLNEYHLLD